MPNISLWGLVVFLTRPYIKLHIIIPLLVGLIIDLIYIYFHENSASWHDAAIILINTPRIFVLILSILITYGLITFFCVQKETTLLFNPNNLLVVEDIVSRAKSYYALSPLPLREWFSPGIVRYFSILLGQHMRGDPKLSYIRVVVFTSPRREAFAKAPYIDREYSLAFGRLHNDSKIPLGVLNSSDLYKILKNMEPKKRQVFVPLPLWVLRNIRRTWPYRVMSPFLRLDFALITYKENDKETVLIEPTGRREVNELSGNDIEPYKELICEITKIICHDPKQWDKFKISADFMKMIKEA